MGGVDKGDQLRKYYHVQMKFKKYYWFLVDVCVTNALILTHINPRSNLSVSDSQLKAFQLQLADDLICPERDLDDLDPPIYQLYRFLEATCLQKVRNDAVTTARGGVYAMKHMVL